MPFKFQLFPLAKNLILARFENLADLFDYAVNSTLNDTAMTLDLSKFANGLY